MTAYRLAAGSHPRIMVYHPVKAREFADALRAHGLEAAAASTSEEAKTLIADTEVLLCWDVPSDVLARAERLRWIQVTGAGVDHLVRRRAALPDGVLVSRIVGQFGTPMSEYVFTYLLSIYKEVAALRDAQARSTWLPVSPGNLAGKTMGIAGIGSIGLELVRKAHAFDMTVHGLSRSGLHADAVDKHFSSNEWQQFVSELDVLVLTLPLTSSTHGVVDSDVLAALKRDAILVNVGRGGLVDELALTLHLRQGRLRAAVLDVFEREPLPTDSPLWSLPNVFVTPHVSGVTDVDTTARYFADNLKRFQSDAALLGLVDFGREY